MTTLGERLDGPYAVAAAVTPPRARVRVHWAVVSAAALVVLLRIPYAGVALSPDEAGFSIVGGQWSRGPELYGHYWVDRPPLLVALFGLAAHLGLGSTYGIRLLGMLAAAVATLAIGLTAHRLGGARAERWSAFAAAAALSTPLLGASLVNGELLAAPFVAVSLLAVVLASSGSVRRTPVWAAAGGASALAAAMVKQNMLDGVVFVVVALLLRTDHRRDVARWWLAGATASVVAVLGGAALLGASPARVWFAMYPFRLESAGVLAGSTLHERLVAMVGLAELEVLSLGPLILVALGVLAWRTRATGTTTGAVIPALFAVAGYDAVSIALGGSYWTHYLVQLIVPTTVALGVTVVRLGRRWSHVGVAFMAICALAWCVTLGSGHRSAGATVGDAIENVARPGDTVVSAFGNADIVAATGLSSPYPYLWSLPAKTLDHRFGTLGRLLSGPAAPTWLVVRGPRTESLLRSSAAGPALTTRYHLVAELCSRRIFVLDSASRATPALERPASCAGGLPALLRP